MVSGCAKPVVIYDGECSFCRAQVDRLKRRDRDDRVEFLPYPSREIEERFPQLSGMDIDAGMRFVAPDGSMSIGADAMHRITLELPRWRRLAWLYRVPGVRWLAGKTYAWIAARRHRLPGSAAPCQSGACRMNSPQRVNHSDTE